MGYFRLKLGDILLFSSGNTDWKLAASTILHIPWIFFFKDVHSMIRLNVVQSFISKAKKEKKFKFKTWNVLAITTHCTIYFHVKKLEKNNYQLSESTTQDIIFWVGIGLAILVAFLCFAGILFKYVRQFIPRKPEPKKVDNEQQKKEDDDYINVDSDFETDY